MSEKEREEAEAERAEAEQGRVEAEEDRVDAEAGDGGVALELGRVQAEEARVVAEDEREEHEVRRRIAEGGPDQHVPGNTETGRVEAEQKREESLLKWLRRWAVLIALTVAFVSLIPSAVGLVLLKREIDHRCDDSSVNRNAIRESAIDSLTTIGYRYDKSTNTIVRAGRPTVSYYVTHEEERNQALARSRRLLDRFPIIDCRKGI